MKGFQVCRKPSLLQITHQTTALVREAVRSRAVTVNVSLSAIADDVTFLVEVTSKGWKNSSKRNLLFLTAARTLSFTGFSWLSEPLVYKFSIAAGVLWRNTISGNAIVCASFHGG